MELEKVLNANRILSDIEHEEANLRVLRGSLESNCYDVLIDRRGKLNNDEVFVRLTDEEKSFILKYLINKKEREIEELKKEFNEL